MSTLLPPNASLTERALEATTAPQVPVNGIRALWDIDRCPESHLPWLAWSLSVDDWDENWPEEDRRNLIRASLDIHRVKGTLAAIRRVLAATGYEDATIIEGLDAEDHNATHNYNHSHFYSDHTHWASYRVYLKRPITLAQAQQVRELLAEVQPARCHLAGLHYDTARNLYDDAFAHDASFPYGVA